MPPLAHAKRGLFWLTLYPDRKDPKLPKGLLASTTKCSPELLEWLLPRHALVLGEIVGFEIPD